MQFGWPLVTVLALLIAAAAVVSAFLKKGKSSAEPESEAEPGEGQSPYRKREWILDHGSEASFYSVLEKACIQVMGPCRVMVQVQLSRLIEVAPGTERAQSWKNKIDRKTVDYVVCDAGTLRPRFAVELDGSSHDRADRKRRDGFVERALEGAGVKLVRVDRRGKGVTVEEVVQKLKAVAGETMPLQGQRRAAHT